MTTRSLTIEEAFALGQAFPYFYKRDFASLSLGENPKNLSAEHLTSCFQLIFFDKTKEIRFFPWESAWKAVEICQEDHDEVITSKHKIQNKIYGNSITLTKFLDYDHQGQCYVKATTISAWEG